MTEKQYKEVIRRAIAQLPEREQPAAENPSGSVVPSEKLSAAMTDLFAQEERRIQHGKALRLTGKAAGIAAAVCAAVFLLVIALSPEVRAGLKAWTRNTWEAEGTVSEAGKTRKLTVALEYIPADLVLQKEEIGETGPEVRLSSREGDRWLQVTFASGPMLRSILETVSGEALAAEEAAGTFSGEIHCFKNGEEMTCIAFTDDSGAGVLWETNVAEGEFFSILRSFSLREIGAN